MFMCRLLLLVIFCTRSYGESNIVDLYDITTDTWTSSYDSQSDVLKKARFDLAAAATGNTIIFAGGLCVPLIVLFVHACPGPSRGGRTLIRWISTMLRLGWMQS